MTDNKAPSYPWYPRDFAADEPVQLMSLAEEGAYRRLLDHQWLHGSIPGDIRSLARICKNIPEREMRRIWATIEPLFSRLDGQPPRLQNRKLERVRRDRNEFIEKQRTSGSRGGKARWERERERQAHDQDSSDPTSDPISKPTKSLVAESYPAVAFASASAEELPTKATPSGGAREVTHSGEVSRAELLGRLRKVCAPRNGKVAEADMRTNADIVDWLAKVYSYEEIARAAAGRRARIERGEIPSMQPGCGWTLKVYRDKDTVRNQMDQDLGAYQAMPPPTPEKDAKRGGAVTGIGDVLDFTKFAKGA